MLLGGVVASVLEDLFIAAKVEITLILQSVGNLLPNSTVLHPGSYESLTVSCT